MSKVTTQMRAVHLADGLTVTGAGLEGINLAGASASLVLLTDHCEARDVMHGIQPQISSTAVIGTVSASAIALNKESPCHYASA